MIYCASALLLPKLYSPVNMIAVLLRKLVILVSEGWSWWWDKHSENTIFGAVATLSAAALALSCYHWAIKKSRGGFPPLPPGPLGCLPFGSGRRMCAGIPLAHRMILYLLASLLHSFDWRLPEGAKLDLEETFGLVLKKTEPLPAIPSARLADWGLYGSCE